jgi:hypothetical protein
MRQAGSGVRIFFNICCIEGSITVPSGGIVLPAIKVDNLLYAYMQDCWPGILTKP